MDRQYNGKTIQWTNNTMDRQYNGQQTKDKRTDNTMGNTKGQTMQWVIDKGETIQWAIDKGQTRQWAIDKG